MSEGQYNKIWDYIDEAKKADLTFIYGGERSMVIRESGNVVRNDMTKQSTSTMVSETKTGTGTDMEFGSGPGTGTGDGFFIPPTILVDVPVTSRIWMEEIFGPVLCVNVSNSPYLSWTHSHRQSLCFSL